METATPIKPEENVQVLPNNIKSEKIKFRKPGLGYRIIKRCFDVIAASVALILLSPVLLILAWLVHKEDGGPATYVCTRVGKNGRPIYFRKFRSMVVDADDLEKYMTPEQLDKYLQEFKLDDDPRITKIGKVLRKSSLDELLQLLSIIKGDMSLVGPRPVVTDELAFYTDAERKLFLSVTPGLTGYWQVNGRNNATYESRERQTLEMYYVENCSLWLDIEIIFKTISVVIAGVGAK